MNWNQLPLLTLVAALLLAGCQDANRQEHALLLAGEQAYEGEDYGGAVRKLTRYMDASPHRDGAARALYVRGMSQARLGRRDAAYTDLKQAVDLAPDADLRWRAGAVLGTLYYEDHAWEAAARQFGDALRYMPAETPADDILWRLGVSYERSGNWSLAVEPFRQLAERFPQSRLADDARRRVEIRAGHFAIQAGVFRTRKSADNLVLQLKDKGLPAYVQIEPRDGNQMNIVLVGRYQRYEAAYEQLAAVRRFIPDAIVWP